MRKHLHISIEGEFHSSGIRFHTFLAAKSFDIEGSVSLKDGNLLIEAEGGVENLDRFLAWCKCIKAGERLCNIEIKEKPLTYCRDFLIL